MYINSTSKYFNTVKYIFLYLRLFVLVLTGLFSLFGTSVQIMIFFVSTAPQNLLLQFSFYSQLLFRSFFCSLVFFVELDFKFTKKYLLFLYFYFGKSLLQIFTGLYMLADHSSMDPVYTLVNRISAFCFVGIAIIHFLLGIFCIDHFAKMQKHMNTSASIIDKDASHLLNEHNDNSNSSADATSTTNATTTPTILDSATNKSKFK